MPVGALDALYPRRRTTCPEQGEPVALASRDGRLIAAAEAIGISLAPM